MLNLSSLSYVSIELPISGKILFKKIVDKRKVGTVHFL